MKVGIQGGENFRQQGRCGDTSFWAQTREGKQKTTSRPTRKRDYKRGAGSPSCGFTEYVTIIGAQESKCC